MSINDYSKGHNIHLYYNKIITINNSKEAINIIYNLARSKQAYELIDKLNDEHNIKIDEVGFEKYLDNVENLLVCELSCIDIINSMLFGDRLLKQNNKESVLFLNIIFTSVKGIRYRIILNQFFGNNIYCEIDDE